MNKKHIAAQKFMKILQKNCLVIKNCDGKVSMLTQDAIWCLDINWDKVLLDTLKTNESCHSYIIVVHIQHILPILDAFYLLQSLFEQTLLILYQVNDSESKRFLVY